jgi:hypothetical protein
MPRGDIETVRRRPVEEQGGGEYSGHQHPRNEGRSGGAGRQMAAAREVEHIIRNVDGAVEERQLWKRPEGMP